MASILNSIKSISDSTRIRLLSLLHQEELSVGELQEILNMGQSRISTQLSILKNDQLVSDRRQGKNKLYSATIPSNFLKLISLAAAELEESEQDKLSLQHLLRKRADHTRAYFDELAGKFGKQYVPGRSWKALAEALLKILNYEVVADLGAGEGTLSQLLAQRAKHVIAVDISPKMVQFGQDLAKQHGLDNLEYRLGDITSPPIDNGTLDLAIFSQALHHADKPQEALRTSIKKLKSHGKIIILDLLQHQVEQARELYHDTHLGFSEVGLYSMLDQAGFQNIEVVVADKEVEKPHFQTLLAVAEKPA